jgi:uncharacterized protein
MSTIDQAYPHCPTVACAQQGAPRIDALDIMRGFALCGIIFANLMSFTGFYSLSLAQIEQLPLLDRFTLFAIDLLVEGKFYSVFAMLLGAGFAIQFARFNAKKTSNNHRFGQLWRRRMLVLMAIGLVHMLFVWHGDILTLYSLLGLCLLMFVNYSNRRLLSAALVLLLLPTVIHIVLALSFEHPFWHYFSDIINNLRAKTGYTEVSLLQLRTSPASLDVFWGNLFSAIPRPMAYLKTGRPFEVLGQFILGMYLARAYLLSKTPLPPPSKATLVTLLVTGLLLNGVYAAIKAATGSPFSIDALGLLQGVVYHGGALCLALGYMALLYRLSLHYQSGQSIFNDIFNALAILGRMSLTCYLTQTSVCIVLFYGYGLSLMGQVPFTSIVGFGCAILGLQYLFARAWLSRFAQGPMEWLWRRLAN